MKSIMVDGRTGGLLGICAGVGIAVCLGGCASSDSQSAQSRTAGGTTASTEAEIELLLTRPVIEYSDPVVRTGVREDAIQGLLGFSFDENAVLRANAIEGMSTAPSRASGLVRAGLADGNAGVRFTAAMVAGRLRLDAVSAQVRSLIADADPRVRFSAVYALVRFGESVDRTVLADAMHSSDPSIRSTAAFVLGEIGDDGAIPVLAEFARVPLPATVSRTQPTAQTILRLQVAEALLKLGHEDVRHVVHAALYPRDREGFEAAALAAQILGDLGDATSIAQLVSVVERTAEGANASGDPRLAVFVNPPELRLAAATALAKMGELDGVYVADQYIGHESAAVRSQVAFLYGAAGRDIDLAKLEAMSSDQNPLVRLSAQAGIVRITGAISGS